MSVAKALIETSKPAPSASNLVSTVQPQAVPEQQSGSPAQSGRAQADFPRMLEAGIGSEPILN
jgi:hypothetical protein